MTVDKLILASLNVSLKQRNNPVLFLYLSFELVDCREAKKLKMCKIAGTNSSVFMLKMLLLLWFRFSFILSTLVSVYRAMMWKHLPVSEFLSRNGDALANDESLELRCLSF